MVAHRRKSYGQRKAWLKTPSTDAKDQSMSDLQSWMPSLRVYSASGLLQVLT